MRVILLYENSRKSQRRACVRSCMCKLWRHITLLSPITWGRRFRDVIIFSFVLASSVTSYLLHLYQNARIVLSLRSLSLNKLGKWRNEIDDWILLYGHSLSNKIVAKIQNIHMQYNTNMKDHSCSTSLFLSPSHYPSALWKLMIILPFTR